jgi:hypothetical protein
MILPKTTQRRITAVLVIANLCLAVVYLSAWINPHAQSSKKTVVRPHTLVKEPVEITIEHRGQPIKANEEFEGEVDWVKDLKLKLKNTSDKTITFIVLDVDFPETVPVVGKVAQRQIWLGHAPDEQQTMRPPLQLRPGESIEVPLDAEYDDIKTLITGIMPLDSITKTVIRLHQVMFDDGTLFSAGVMYRRNPDPNDPHKWIKIEK